MNRNRLILVLGTVLAGSVALVGCKKNEEPVATPAPTETPAQAPAPMPEPAPAPAAVTSVNSVDLGTMIGADNKIGSPATSFATTDQAIYTSIGTDGPAASNVAVKWSHVDSNQVVHEESKEVPAGPQTTQFEIKKPDGWPVGKYKLEVMVNGAVAQTREFDVK